jgi:hypothetical protein
MRNTVTNNLTSTDTTFNEDLLNQSTGKANNMTMDVGDNPDNSSAPVQVYQKINTTTEGPDLPPAKEIGLKKKPTIKEHLTNHLEHGTTFRRRDLVVPSNENEISNINGENNVKPPIHFSGHNVLVFCFYTSIVLFLVGGAIITCVLTAYYVGLPGDIGNVAEVLAAINLNAKLAPWIDVVQSISTTCPSGYTAATVGTWEGTVDGCDKFFTGLKRGKCGRKEHDPKINAIAAIDLLYWKAQILCIKQTSDYYSAPTCNVGYIQCSPGMCYNAVSGCPITNLTMTTADYIPDPSMIQVTGATGTNKWYIKRENGSLPIVRLQVTFGNLPCLQTSKVPDNTSTYILAKVNQQGCGQLGVYPHNHVVDTDVEFNLYQSNKLDLITVKLPNYAAFTWQRIAVLVSQKKFMVKTTPQCLSLNYGDLTSASSTLGDMRTSADNASLGFISIHFLLLGYFLMSLLAICTGDSKAAASYLLFLSFLCFIPLTVLWGLFYADKTDTEQYISYLPEIASYNCYQDDILNFALSSYTTAYSQTMITFNLITILWVLNVFLAVNWCLTGIRIWICK